MHVAEPDMARLAALVLSPGIPHVLPKPHPLAAAARAAGVPILSDAELLFQAVRSNGSRARFAGVTGTNGKSTTTALLAHIVAAEKKPVAAGGNLGTAALALPLLPDDGVYVLEMSSYMLERLATLRFDAAAMLNLSADHIDRHGDMAGYAAAKLLVFSRQRPEDIAVVGVDDALSRAMAERLRGGPARLVTISSDTADVCAPGGVLRDSAGVICDLATARALPGAHNAQNAGGGGGDGARPRHLARGDCARHRDLSRAAAPPGECRHRRRHFLRQRQQGYKRRFYRPRAGLLCRASSGSPAAWPRPAASSRWRRFFPMSRRRS